MEHCYINGTIKPYKECHLHISDLLIQRGYGVFDFFRVREGEIPWLEDYTDRLFNSIRYAGIESPVTRHEFLEAIDNLKQLNQSENSAFKVLVTGGYSEDLGTVSGHPNMLILHTSWSPLPAKTRQQGVALISDEFIRPNPEIKTMYYFNSLRLRRKMTEYGAADVLYHQDLVTETSRASIFCVRDGKIFTPAKNILEGITRKQVMRQFPEIEARDIRFDDFLQMDEVFITSTTRDITPVVSIDGKTIGNQTPGPVTRELQENFRIS
jgi:branched-subunit amino acid aminotransferase/4-amino-4-deoxychorismate lyase